MFNIKSGLSDKKKQGRIEAGILVLFVTIIIAVVIILSIAMFEVSSSIISNKVSALIAADSQQLELNVNNYFGTVEKTTSLMFANAEYYQYNAADESIPEYDRIKIENDIRNRIVELGMLENYADFCIVYPNEKTVGWVSNVTNDLFPGKMYENFSKCITNVRTNDGWSFGVGGAQDRMYYVKRLNDNAILITSFYGKELGNLFEYPDALNGMTIRLISEDDSILFSSTRSEIGGKLSRNISSIIEGKKNAMILKNKYLVNITTCDNHWRVVCAIPEKIIMKEIYQLRFYTIMVAIIIGVICVTFGTLLIAHFTKPLNGVVNDLKHQVELDHMSGLYNKVAFETHVRENISQLDEMEGFTFTMIDVDNFKNINDLLGHNYGDVVIKRMSQLLKEKYQDEYMVGRVGGDEFSLYRQIKPGEDPYDKSKNEMDDLLKSFSVEFADENEKCGISLSVGVAIHLGEKTDFDDVYQKADEALYRSKRSGKNQVSIYREATI